MLAALVSFPSTDVPSTRPPPNTSQPHLPFRRISLPTPPSPKFRESLVSVTSVDSFPEESPMLGTSSTSSSHIGSVVRKPTSSGASSSVEANRRKRRDLRRVDEAREAKRRKVIHELYETEKAYVDGLELIYSLFLTPIIASLDTPRPLLDRAALTSVFSNFIDIWNLHRSFFSSLHSLLSPFSSASTPPPVSPVLVSHFPYLSLYTPFITSFNTTVTALTNMLSPSSPSYNQPFASFITAQETDPRCRKLKLRDWFLTIVQRCPRYLLLLKDLLQCTDPEDTEYEQLTAVHTLVSKITLSLNTSLHTHAQTLSLVALQRSTSSLPPTLHFVSPGRTLLQRGPLIMLERNGEGRQREFLLFSDCLVWLENESGVMAGRGFRPAVSRSRSKSEAELSALRARFVAASSNASLHMTNQSPDLEPPAARPYSAIPQHSALTNMKRHASTFASSSSASSEEKWTFKGKAELVDLEVVVVSGSEEAQDRQFDVLSPEGSFVVYASKREERDAWTTAIRNAKASLLVSLNIIHPNSTLTSSASTNHLRRSLQALPFPPHDERIGTIGSGGHARAKKGTKGGKEKQQGERRGRVEHWVPAIWIPDAKTEGCMRCGRGFGWRRRRHHCRLCGRCVCAACSGRTFFISDSSSKEPTKSARSCDACYETVFPLLDPPTDPEQDPSTTPQTSQSSPYSNTISSIAGLPSWLSMPSLPLSKKITPDPGALMALDREPKREERERYHIDHNDDIVRDDDVIAKDGSSAEIGPRGRVKMKTSSRPRSSYEIWENNEEGDGRKDGADLAGSSITRMDKEEDEETRSNVSANGTASEGHSVSSSPPRRENTARRHKRFSLPAVALQTTSVVAQTTGGDAVGGVGKVKRFSLVLAGRGYGHGGSKSEVVVSKKGNTKLDLGKGVAAGKLSELLVRRRA